MRKFFGVFGDLFLFNSRFDAGKPLLRQRGLPGTEIHFHFLLIV